MGHGIKKNCQLDENPYFDKFNDAGGVDIVMQIRSLGISEYSNVCDHLLKYCDLEEEMEEQQLNI